VIDLVMTVEGCDFRSALELIRRRWLRGEDVPLTRPIRPLPKPTELPADVLSALAAAQAFYAELLWADEGAPAREYLRARGISEDTARQLGVATDALSERLVFPVRSLGGQVVFLIGRALRPRQRPKYLGLSLPKAPMVFGEPVLGTLVVEGAVDLAALAQWGYGRYYRLVAMLGTGERAVLPYLVGPVTVLPDQDGAGWGAARRLAEALQPGRTVRVLVCRQAYARLRAAGDAAALAHAQALLDAGVVVGVEWGGAKDVGDLLQRGESGRAALGIGD
jgi:DNA primase